MVPAIVVMVTAIPDAASGSSALCCCHVVLCALRPRTCDATGRSAGIMVRHTVPSQDVAQDRQAHEAGSRKERPGHRHRAHCEEAPPQQRAAAAIGAVQAGAAGGHDPWHPGRPATAARGHHRSHVRPLRWDEHPWVDEVGCEGGAGGGAQPRRVRPCGVPREGVEEREGDAHGVDAKGRSECENGPERPKVALKWGRRLAARLQRHGGCAAAADVLGGPQPEAGEGNESNDCPGNDALPA